MKDEQDVKKSRTRKVMFIFVEKQLRLGDISQTAVRPVRLSTQNTNIYLKGLTSGDSCEFMCIFVILGCNGLKCDSQV